MSVGVLCSTKWLPHAQNRPLKRVLDQVRVILIALSEKTYLCPENGLLIHVSSQVVRPLPAKPDDARPPHHRFFTGDLPHDLHHALGIGSPRWVLHLGDEFIRIDIRGLHDMTGFGHELILLQPAHPRGVQ